MFRLGNYKFGFDVWGLVLFLAVMLPNFIWFAVPAGRDVLREPSAMPLLDGVASVFQMLMIPALCFIRNEWGRKRMSRALFMGIVALILSYYVGWGLYYGGVIHPAVILDLCVAPCLAFVFFSVARRNLVALVPASVFMVCHVLYGVMNFVCN